jgi:predicted aconitase
MYQIVSGKYSLHDVQKNNGEKVCSLAEANQLMIMSTCFEHKQIHKATWVSPDKKTMNQIDHILVIQDVRTYRGANCDSDHWMVVAKIKQDIKVLHTNKYKQ